MKKVGWKKTLAGILGCEAVGGLAALLCGAGFGKYAAEVAKPPLSPPPAVFPAVWTALYVLMGIGAARVYAAERDEERKKALLIFALQLALNFVWPLFFFGAEAFGLALLCLLALLILILSMILAYMRVDRPAALMQLPYLVWACFAAYLNAGVL
ncbi:MAG: tryptophan-rich sensory protein, partial [Clostridia bacterium]|nr:tryptophan-rich sensory protein [Clostridia bacterium]